MDVRLSEKYFPNHRSTDYNGYFEQIFINGLVTVMKAGT